MENGGVVANIHPTSLPFLPTIPAAQLLAGADDALLSRLFLVRDPKAYAYLTQGGDTGVTGMDDKANFQAARKVSKRRWQGLEVRKGREGKDWVHYSFFFPFQGAPCIPFSCSSLIYLSFS